MKFSFTFTQILIFLTYCTFFVYRVDETASEVQQRLSNWDQYLEEDDEEGEKDDKKETENKILEVPNSVEREVIDCPTNSDDGLSQQKL